MAFSEFEEKRYEKLVRMYIERRRPPAYIRNQVDLSFRIKGQSVELFEIRSMWNNKNKKTEHAIAKATYLKSQKSWKIYWQRADLKWHRYDPHPEAKTLEEFLTVIEKDEYACFYG